MHHTAPTWQSFENLVHRILEANNFSVAVHPPKEHAKFDFLGQLGFESWAIEVKYYRTVRAQPSLIEAAATRLAANAIAAQATKGMLVVSCVLPPELREVLDQKFDVAFVDRVDLRNWASAMPHLAEELDALVETDPGELQTITPSRSDPLAKGKPLGHLPVRLQDTRGTDLCKKLKNIQRGKEDWKEYEEVCVKFSSICSPTIFMDGTRNSERTTD